MTNAPGITQILLHGLLSVARSSLGVVAGLLAVCILATQIGAQVADENKFTFHVYVDPLYGDDEAAFRLNPGPRGSTPIARAFLADYPSVPPLKFPDVLFPNEEGFLQHAPYSFRTLTGGTGALAYINMILPPRGEP